MTDWSRIELAAVKHDLSALLVAVDRVVNDAGGRGFTTYRVSRDSLEYLRGVAQDIRKAQEPAQWAKEKPDETGT